MQTETLPLVILFPDNSQVSVSDLKYHNDEQALNEVIDRLRQISNGFIKVDITPEYTSVFYGERKINKVDKLSPTDTQQFVNYIAVYDFLLWLKKKNKDAYASACRC